jgi:hypothetical protein
VLSAGKPSDTGLLRGWADRLQASVRTALREVLGHQVRAIEDAFAAQRGSTLAAMFHRLPDTPRRSWL